MSRPRSLDVPVLARVEGEGAMHVRIRDQQVQDVKLSIYEPPRFFEGFMRGRHSREAPDITARICGICPVAYQTAACNAIERVSGVTVTEPIRLMRRLLYCGEWIESHVLHIYLLHAPDFLGYEDAITMAAEHGDLVQQGLQLKKTGNELMDLTGGRAVHPINVKVGGHWRFPTHAELAAYRPKLEQAHDEAVATVRAVAGLTPPDLEMPYHFVALDPENGDYPLEDGRYLLSGDGESPSERIPLELFDERIVELHVEHSNALHARLHGVGSYVVGPLARWALLRDRLDEETLALADEVGFNRVVRNPFASIVVRALEVVYAVNEARRIIDGWPADPGPCEVDVPPQEGTGYGASEAPRGLLVHRYRLDGDGVMRDVKIVPPTAQNQAQIEADLFKYVEQNVDLDDERLTRECEMAIRNYDPCISCATHFLKLHVDRG